MEEELAMKKIDDINSTYDENRMAMYDGKYVFVNPISEDNIKSMRDNMSPEDVKSFDNFVDTAWRW